MQGLQLLQIPVCTQTGFRKTSNLALSDKPLAMKTTPTTEEHSNVSADQPATQHHMTVDTTFAFKVSCLVWKYARASEKVIAAIGWGGGAETRHKQMKRKQQNMINQD